MACRYPNHRLVKIHRTYTVEEGAELLGVHKGTVRQWLKKGLRTVDCRRPALIQGAVLKAYLHERRVSKKRPCRPGEGYCMRCRSPKRLLPGSASYQFTTPHLGNLVGFCSDCGTRIYRRVSFAKLAEVSGDLQVSMSKALEHIDESLEPSVNSDFSKGVSDHD